MLATLMFFTALTALITLLPLCKHPHWLIRGMDFPRLQIAFMAALLLLVSLTTLDLYRPATWLVLAVAGTSLAMQLWWILPYTPLWRREVKSASGTHPEQQLSIITANVLTPNRNAAALIARVKQYRPDILVTLESDQWWQDQLDVLTAEMPYSVKCPLDNLYGMHVYSTLPLEDSSISYLVEPGVPSIHTSVRLRSGVSVRVHFLHPAPPSPTENPESAQRDAELVVVARSIAETDQPVIVTGDLNDVAWSATTRLFRKISGLLDPRVGRGMYNTFHVDYPFFRWPLDHLFHSQHFTLRSIKRLASIGSDHFALFTCLELNPKKGIDQQGLTPTPADHAWSKEIAHKQNVSKQDVPEPGKS